MAQAYDVSLKAIFLTEGDGIIHRLLFGGKVADVLPTEQPEVRNRRGDMVVRIEDGGIHHVEFEAKNEAHFPRRMLRSYAYLADTYGEEVWQTVLYMGREPMRIADHYQGQRTRHEYDIVNLRQLEAPPLLASEDWADNVLALLAKGDPGQALNVILPRLREMPGALQELASGTLTLLSGILGLEETLEEKLKEFGMIDVMENKILGPAIRRGIEQGMQQGIEQGVSEGKRELLVELLADRFGALPQWAEQRLRAGSPEQLDRWAKRILREATLNSVLD